VESDDDEEGSGVDEGKLVPVEAGAVVDTDVDDGPDDETGLEVTT
jgi:hypothetical protein